MSDHRHDRDADVRDADVPAIRADLLVALEDAGAVTPTELHLPDGGMPLERFEAVGAMLAQLRSSVRWWVGDWLVYGEQHFGAIYPQLGEVLAMHPEGMLEAQRVALAFPPERRRPGLTFSHHRLVAARWADPHRERLLDLAEAERLSSRDLDVYVRQLREQVEAGEEVAEVEAGTDDAAEGASSPPRGGSQTATECAAVVDEVLAELHSELIACGYDRALRVTVEVASPEIAYRVSVGPEQAAAA